MVEVKTTHLVGTFKVNKNYHEFFKPFVCDRCGRDMNDGESLNVIGEHPAEFDANMKYVNGNEPFGKITRVCDKCLAESELRIEIVDENYVTLARK